MLLLLLLLLYVVVVVALLSVLEDDLAVWKHLTRWPTSGRLAVSAVRNRWTSSFLQRASQWYRDRALTTVTQTL